MKTFFKVFKNWESYQSANLLYFFSVRMAGMAQTAVFHLFYHPLESGLNGFDQPR